jgi:hypothetical protein
MAENLSGRLENSADTDLTQRGLGPIVDDGCGADSDGNPKDSRFGAFIIFCAMSGSQDCVLTQLTDLNGPSKSASTRDGLSPRIAAPTLNS